MFTKGSLGVLTVAFGRTVSILPQQKLEITHKCLGVDGESAVEQRIKVGEDAKVRNLGRNETAGGDKTVVNLGMNLRIYACTSASVRRGCTTCWSIVSLILTSSCKVGDPLAPKQLTFSSNKIKG